jgi:hypothetical protein
MKGPTDEEELAAYASLYAVVCVQNRLNPVCLGMESEIPCFDAAGVAHDEVKQDLSGFLTLDPIGRPFEWRTAMFANPTHTSTFSKANATFDRTGSFPSREGIVS